MRIKKTNLLILFSILISACFAQDTELVAFKDMPGIRISNWELYYLKNPFSLYKDVVPIKVNNSRGPVNEFDLKNYNGVCWFRKVLKVDSNIHKNNVCINFSLIGAAEIYINKEKVLEFGQVSHLGEIETLINTNRYYLPYRFECGKAYEILIRYSNHTIQASYDSRGKNVFGVELIIYKTDLAMNQSSSERAQNISVGTFFIIFFLTLFMLHVAIYTYNRSEISNLYYALFCLFVSLLMLGSFAYRFTSYNDILRFTGLFIIFSPILIFCILPFMIRSFFHLKNPKWYKFIVITVLLLCIIPFTGLVNSFLLNVIFILLTSVESIRNLIIAIKLKKRGVKIIGLGLVFFTVSIAAIILLIYQFGGEVSPKDPMTGLLVFTVLLCAVFSIPFSITILLASNISFTNKSLQKKLVEVEELSAKSIEQEKEKQQILAEQNLTLETQVFERTIEITEQKKVIEEKNKDIIDSINYAKRIQSAMLPDEASFKSIFSSSFVLYSPRDIVSGDFYYATEQKGKKLIIAADCTGHGVPGALMSMVGCNIINKITHENGIVEPNIVLQTLHTELRHALKQNLKGSVNHDGMDVSAVLITETEIIYAGANRPVIWFNHKGELQELKPTKTPIGGSHIEAVSITQIALPKADIKQLFLFSDGFADQFGGPEGKKLMISKFKLWLTQIINMKPEEQYEFLEKNFAQWKQQSEQVDDVMVIGIKI